MNKKFKADIKKFVVNGKTYSHYRRHKPNCRAVAKDLFKKNFSERNEEEWNPFHEKIFNTAFNMGYDSAWERDNEMISDVCLNCKIKLGFRGFCSKDCHKEYTRRPKDSQKG